MELRKRRIDNLEEFKSLIKRYESITIEEIKGAWDNRGLETANKLTGFGFDLTCTLCVKVNYNCEFCAWEELTGYQCKILSTQKLPNSYWKRFGRERRG